MYKLAFYLLRLWCLLSVRALPTWEGLTPRTDFIDSLVPSNTFIEVLGPSDVMKTQSHLTSHIPGEPGNLTALPTLQLRAPSLFSVVENNLWQFKNTTTIYPVVVKNTTLVDGVPPLQLVLGKQKSGAVSGGTWLWRGTMLQYRLGLGGNGGVFYNCSLQDGTTGIFMFLEP
ncbi:hypothetical protein C8R45DRAFT_1141061 [Mycena sanguinolenta]|nr:hypothetical protein C8R45DRAFT_1141061 [Mycena sanguinolenta]